MNILQFLRERERDGKMFVFEYTNNNGRTRTHEVKKVNFISDNGKLAGLFVGNKNFNYSIEKMEDLRILGHHSEIETRSISSNKKDNEMTKKVPDFGRSKRKNYIYLNKLTQQMIEKNILEHGINEDEGLNYSLSHIKNEILNDEKSIYNKKVLKKFLEGNKAERKLTIEPELILPFTSNLSQKEAIKNALMYDISIIQGPPGTGKTQTILNIICNSIIKGKRVLVVSNNNSAIDNVNEKLSNLENLFNFSVRLGSSKPYIETLMSEIYTKIIRDSKQNFQIDSNFERVNLIDLKSEIDEKEKQLEQLIDQKNLLNELKTQKRHIEKKLATYGNEKMDIVVNKFFTFPSQLKNEINFLRKQRTKPANILSKAYFKLRFSAPAVDIENYTLYQWRLEKLYAIKMINYLENKIAAIPIIEEELKNKYEEYKIESLNQINDSVRRIFQNKQQNISKILDTLESDFAKFSDIKKEILDTYPVILTTIDSVASNVGYRKYDMVIVDEASQANIISILPTLNTAEQIVVVGDSKQLSHIVDNELKKCDLGLSKLYEIDNNYSFSNTNFLDSIMHVCNPPTVLLKEHYRCDFNIINYCNKKFYDGELIVYSKNSFVNSLKIMPLNKEKNSSTGIRKNGQNSYFNEIEEKEIILHLKNNNENVSVITPYGKQEENLIAALPELEHCIGTIYKFQGRENKRVLLSTVLTKESSHLQKSDLLGNQTVNVAVSRAEEELILFTHDHFFKEMNHGLKDLIEYIETYGSVLESNVNSIFAYLYKQLPYYKKEKDYDSLWEKQLHKIMKQVLQKYPGFIIQMKLSLADIARDKEFLDSNLELKRFALNKNTHLDFTIISELTNKPILAIELDGKHHDEHEQQIRDEKKDKILGYHGVPIWRIKSTDAIEEDDISEKLRKYIYDVELEGELDHFLEDNNWKIN
ncbi:AAA domain-containing protein [Enterococcus plantarum]|uniref:AAA domain-containing protein n=1 Tax=Enterococcus plantarum TaxID=1077675 RepID=UPI001A8BFAB1|nr:AAA domain-containing protein [Enterococcus plantarum]MBO0422186.1 AAA family ATPase [Enterococcus plantarum]